MDNGLVHIGNRVIPFSSCVLILFVMDNGLVLLSCGIWKKMMSLNPFCNGQWSRT